MQKLSVTLSLSTQRVSNVCTLEPDSSNSSVVDGIKGIVKARDEKEYESGRSDDVLFALHSRLLLLLFSFTAVESVCFSLSRFWLFHLASPRSVLARVDDNAVLATVTEAEVDVEHHMRAREKLDREAAEALLSVCMSLSLLTHGCGERVRGCRSSIRGSCPRSSEERTERTASLHISGSLFRMCLCRMRRACKLTTSWTVCMIVV